MVVSFWQKYFRNELSAIERLINSGLRIDCDLDKRRSEIIKNLARVQIAEHRGSNDPFDEA